MIKKLKIRVVALAQLSLLLVLTLIMGSVNLLNYKKIVWIADDTLALLGENNGVFPKPEGGRGNKGFPEMPPELPYESRFFSVWLDGMGNVQMTDTGRIAAVDEKTAVAYARQVAGQGKERGFLENYRYLRQPAKEEGLIQVIFLDCRRELATFRNFLFTSCGISLLGLLGVLGLLLLFSGRMVRPVLESYEKQKRFVTDAGHELKTPLAVLNADADVLELEIGENEWLSDMKNQTGRLSTLTDSLIRLSRMEEGFGKLQMLPFSLSDMAGETARSFQVLARAAGKKFAVRIQPMLSLKGDQEALRQLVTILLDNALKYSGEEGEISMILERQGRRVCLAVENTLASRPPEKEELARMFDRFYRRDTSRNSQTGGYGLGLSIAKAVVEGHRGKIAAYPGTAYKKPSLRIQATLPL